MFRGLHLIILEGRRALVGDGESAFECDADAAEGVFFKEAGDRCRIGEGRQDRGETSWRLS
jgi:hypothetical protein